MGYRQTIQMAESPNALSTFKNFAMSQSPPSYSPMRRRQSSESQTDSQDSAESQAEASPGISTNISPQGLFQDAPPGDTQMEGTDDEEADAPGLLRKSVAPPADAPEGTD